MLLVPKARAQNADSDLVKRLERQLQSLDETYRLSVPEDQPISERLLLDYGASTRFGVLLVDDNFGTTRTLRETDARIYLQAELDGAHRFYGQLRFLYDDFNAGDSFDGQGDDLREPIGDRYWYSFDLRGLHRSRTGETLDNNFTVKVGRQFVHWGSGLSLSSVLYAVVADVELGDVGLTGLFGQTPRTGTVDFDGSRPSFDTNTERRYWGAILEYRGNPNHKPYVSYLNQSDRNQPDFALIQPDPNNPFNQIPTSYSYDSQYIIAGSQGNLGPAILYRTEAIRELGRGLSSPVDPSGLFSVNQTREDIRAWAGVGTLSYLVRDEENTRLDLEVAAGSGDKDRLDSADTIGGTRSGSTDRAFNGLGYVNTGLALAPEISNLVSVQLGVSTSPPFPGPRKDALRVGVAGFVFTKVHSGGPISVPTSDHQFVGGEVDLFADYHVTSDLSVSIRYGVFLPGDALHSSQTPGSTLSSGQHDPRNYGYVGVTYVF